MFLLHDYLERTTRRLPDRVAVACAGREVTFAELFANASAVATALSERKIGRGDVVVVAMAKSVDVVAVYFGVLMTGAAYAPLNADAPRPYVHGIARRSSARLVVTDGWAFEERDGEGNVACVAATALLATPAATTRFARGIDCDIAYVHFTSGSTGQPKGVAISHRSARTYFDICDGLLKGGASDVILNQAPLSFDLSSFDIHLAVRWGARLRMLRAEETIAPATLLGILADDGPTILYTVPTALNRIAGFPSTAELRVPSMRALVFAGEPPDVAALRKLRPVFPNATFHHWYGSTEAALVTAVAFPPDAALPERMPLGTLVDNVAVALRDEQGGIHEATSGARGELLVDATLVFDAYLGNEDATSAAFVPRGGLVSARWFRTRDVVRLDESGAFFFESRVDRMVKIRGHRIDLDDITSTMRQHPDVDQAAVIAQRHGAGDAALYAFFASASAAEESVRQFLANALPRYMVPTAVFRLTTGLPTTATGKIDIRSLESLVDDELARRRPRSRE